MVEKFGEGFAARGGVLRGVGEFFQVLDAGEGFGGGFVFEGADVAGAVVEELDEFGEGGGVAGLAEGARVGFVGGFVIAGLGGDDAVRRSRMASMADCLRGMGAKGLSGFSVACPDRTGRSSVASAFSGAMVEISSLGPKSKPKLKLVSKAVLASLGVTVARVSSVAKPKSKSVSSSSPELSEETRRQHRASLNQVVSALRELRRFGRDDAVWSSGRCRVESFGEEVGAQHGAGVVDEPAEAGERGEGAGGQELVFDGAGDGVPGAHAGGEGDALEGVHGGFADAARRRVDDAAEGDGVVRVLHELEVAEHVFDFGAVVEAEAADHVVLDLVAAQRFFHQARLRVGAIEHGAARGFDGVVGAGGGFAEVLVRCGRR